MPETLQRLMGVAGSILSLPLVVTIAVLIRLDSPGWPFHVARRVGEGGRTFRVVKLRTMVLDADRAGPRITAAQDPRVTRIGRFLRSHRIDELPQLWNVMLGQMLLVGPRPEEPQYVDRSNPVHRRVFAAKPGITGLTQLAYARESEFLDPAHPDEHYVSDILPAKLALDERYLEIRSSRLDAWILLQTVLAVIGRPPNPRSITERYGVRYGLGDPPGEL